MKKNKIFEIGFITISLGLLITIFITNNNDLKKHCQNAVCNKDKTMCYNYETNAKGKTIKTWEGNCSKIK